MKRAAPGQEVVGHDDVHLLGVYDLLTVGIRKALGGGGVHVEDVVSCELHRLTNLNYIQR